MNNNRLDTRSTSLKNSQSKIWYGCIVALLFSIVLIHPAQAQEIDILLKGGHVIDPKNEIDSPMDVAIADGKILHVASNISTDKVRLVVDVSGLYVTPGLIDIHAHVFHGHDDSSWLANAHGSVAPDAFTFRSGITTIVDAGSSGWRNFPRFKQQTIDKSNTRVLAFLSIVGEGMQGRHTAQNLNDMEPVVTSLIARQYSDYIVGIKKHHYMGSDFIPVERAVEAAELANIPVMVDFGDADPPLSLETLFMEKLRPGDMFTHTYSFTPNREEIVDANFKVKPIIFEAQERGIIFDVGHGQGSWVWHQAIPSFEQGFYPDVISTDLHIWSMNHAMKDMNNVMSKLLSMGMPLSEVILRSTWNPAKYIKRTDLGHLSEGAEADIAVFNLRNGEFGYLDSLRKTMKGNKKLETELTILNGRVMWDLNGKASPEWDEQPGDRYGW
jgi:dihydroorotase